MAIDEIQAIYHSRRELLRFPRRGKGFCRDPFNTSFCHWSLYSVFVNCWSWSCRQVRSFILRWRVLWGIHSANSDETDRALPQGKCLLGDVLLGETGAGHSPISLVGFSKWRNLWLVRLNGRFHPRIMYVSRTFVMTEYPEWLVIVVNKTDPIKCIEPSAHSQVQRPNQAFVLTNDANVVLDGIIMSEIEIDGRLSDRPYTAELSFRASESG
jgi:hypothetical protein